MFNSCIACWNKWEIQLDPWFDWIVLGRPTKEKPK